MLIGELADICVMTVGGLSVHTPKCAFNLANRNAAESVAGRLTSCKRFYSASFVALASLPDLLVFGLLLRINSTFAMGGKSSKLVITPENVETVSWSDFYAFPNIKSGRFIKYTH